eukprot:TCONS_00033427-protein
MSSNEKIVQEVVQDLKDKVSIPSDEKAPITTSPVSELKKAVIMKEDENKELKRIIYTIEQLLEIKIKEECMKKPSYLQEQHFKDGKWDPEAWHRSDDSRSASPQVINGKTVLAEGKKIELMDDIELAPKRQSFKQGCQVKAQTTGPGERFPADKTRRLTGRASNQRRNFERESDSISAASHDFERMRKNLDFQSRDRSYSNDRHDKYSKHNQEREKFEDKPRKPHSESQPEWMSDEPINAEDSLNFFNINLEEDKKAWAAQSKKKKVRISPDVNTQQVTKKERKTRVPSPKIVQNGGKSTYKTGNFDINEFMGEVEYFPPEQFPKDNTGTKSRFTQFFTQRNTNTVMSQDGVLIPDNVINGPHPVSPKVSQALFAPIQPAPALLNAAANAHARQTSNIASIVEKNRQEKLLENINKTKREVRGSLSVDELEGRSTKPQPLLTQHDIPSQKPHEHQQHDNNAFNMLLQSMKNSGQLPDKPSPAVSGLPAHLLPQPPSRTSPVFEKLKRTLSRSPSPKDFAKAVSTVASIISTHPSINQELAILKAAESISEPVGINTIAKTPKSQSIQSQVRETTASPSIQTKKPLNPFTPTSVLKKMHKEKKGDGEFESQNPDVSIVSVQNNGKYPDVLPDQVKKQDRQSEKVNLEDQFLEAIVTTPDRFKWQNDTEVSRLMPFHSAPVTPKNHFPTVAQTNVVSASAPGTPDRHPLNPPQVKRMSAHPPGLSDKGLLAPSAFKAVGSNSSSNNDLGAIGSGAPTPSDKDKSAYNTFVDQLGKIQLDRTSPRQLPADPKLAPGNRSFSHRELETRQNEVPHGGMIPPRARPPSQQQQLLQAQRMAQIQQAQLLQQQKLQEIAKLGKQGSNLPQSQGPVSNIRQLLPDPEQNDNPQMQHPADTRRSPYLQQQQQQQQQILAFQQQQLLNQQRAAQMNQPRMPRPRWPMNPGVQPQMPNTQTPFNVNLAAQALVQQQMLNQAARARLFAQASLLQQQPQVVQAALMAQAALVRGQAQAQAAMMLNPRNINAMAEHMGLRQPYNANKQGARKQGSNATTPTSQMGGSPENGDDKNVLSKWFSNDVLQQTQPKSESGPPSGKFLSVEELERGQK